jgi:hypothetical protein
MGGNRDFLLGDEFAKQTNCVLFNTPYLKKIFPLSVYKENRTVFPFCIKI